jgi:hypothetical protein
MPNRHLEVSRVSHNELPSTKLKQYETVCYMNLCLADITNDSRLLSKNLIDYGPYKTYAESCNGYI